MNENKITEPVVEKASETIKAFVESVSVEKTPAALSNVIKVKDYLNPKLFDDIRVVSRQEIEGTVENKNIPAKIDQA